MSRNSSSEISNAQLSGKKVEYGYFFFFCTVGIRAAIKNFVSRQIAYRDSLYRLYCVTSHSCRAIIVPSVKLQRNRYLNWAGGFCGVDGKTQWARNRRFESNSKRICFSRNTGHVVQIFMIYQISFFPLQLFLHLGYSQYPRVKNWSCENDRVRERNLDKLLKKENDIRGSFESNFFQHNTFY